MFWFRPLFSCFIFECFEHSLCATPITNTTSRRKKKTVGESATTVPTESGYAETTVSSSDETLANLGAAQAAKTSCDVRDFRTKTFTKMKGFKGDEKAWPDWRYKFRAGKRRRSWIGRRTDTINRFLNQTLFRLLQKRNGLTWQISTCSSSTVIWFLPWKSALTDLRLCVTPRLKWGWMHGDG